jgi:hypothetical protein
MVIEKADLARTEVYRTDLDGTEVSRSAHFGDMA